MAIGWMTILSNVPWADVIKNAPAVVGGARELWKKVGGKAPAADIATASESATPEQRIEQLQARVEELHTQMLAAGDIIQSLAEQNVQLIARVEKTRRRLLLLAVANLVTAAVALAAWLR